MIPTFLIEKIRKRAHEIWEFRQDNGMIWIVDGKEDGER